VELVFEGGCVGGRCHLRIRRDAMASGSLAALGDKAFAHGVLAGKLARAANGFALFADALFRRLFECAAGLHLAKDAFTLQLALQNTESLIDIVVSDQNLQCLPSFKLE